MAIDGHLNMSGTIRGFRTGDRTFELDWDITDGVGQFERFDIPCTHVTYKGDIDGMESDDVGKRVSLKDPAVGSEPLAAGDAVLVGAGAGGTYVYRVTPGAGGTLTLTPEVPTGLVKVGDGEDAKFYTADGSEAADERPEARRTLAVGARLLIFVPGRAVVHADALKSATDALSRFTGGDSKGKDEARLRRAFDEANRAIEAGVPLTLTLGDASFTVSSVGSAVLPVPALPADEAKRALTVSSAYGIEGCELIAL